MKRLSFFGIVLAVIILVVFGVWFVNSPTSKLSTTRETPIATPFPESQPALPSALVTPISSNVMIAPVSNTSNFQLISIATKAVSGSHVKTNATGRALLEGINTTVLDSNTELTIATLDMQKNQTRLQLEAGNVWSRVKKLSDEGEFYEIETQHARASVRGTSFGLKREGKKLTLYVTEGVVHFTPIAPQDDTSIQYSDANVKAGQKAILYEDDYLPTVSEITDADKKDPWFVFNNPSIGSQPSSKTSVPTSNRQTNTATSVRPETIAPTPLTESPQTETAPPALEPTSVSEPNRTIAPETTITAPQTQTITTPSR